MIHRKYTELKKQLVDKSAEAEELEEVEEDSQEVPVFTSKTVKAQDLSQRGEVSEVHPQDIQEEVSEVPPLDLQETSSASCAKLVAVRTSSPMTSLSVGY